jgi:beta-glucanase (GH16 family)
MSSNLPTPAGFTANELVFDDNFLGNTLNSSYWNSYMTSNSTKGGPWDSNGNGGSGLGGPYDADYDMPYEVAVDNGLTLNAVRQSVEGANYVNGQVVPQTFPVTAGVVDTYGKVEFDGGYLQISMEEPSGDGSWPGLWLLPGAGAGNVGNNFEIDIQEGGYTDGSANPDDVLAYHLHTPKGTFGGEVNTGVDLTAGYNTYAIDWVPSESVTWYLNGHAVAEITSAEAPIPDEPMELIMSNQVATSAATGWRTTMDSSTPASMPMRVAEVQLYKASTSNSSAPAAPTMAITSGGSTTTLAAQTIKGTVDIADAGSTVKLLDGSTQIGSAVAASNGAWSANVTLANRGANVLTATDANAAGTGKSNAVTFVLHSVAPPPASNSHWYPVSNSAADPSLQLASILMGDNTVSAASLTAADHYATSLSPLHLAASPVWFSAGHSLHG